MEVSLFGPGFGESVVVHLGNGDWAVIDSSQTPSKRPAALDYLVSLGLDPAATVRLVVATHWHDDHMRGLSAILKAAPQARFACSGALRSPEFTHLIATSFGGRHHAGGSGIDEIRQTFEELKHRTQSLRLASSGNVLWERTYPVVSEIRALSPSDAAMVAATARLSAAAQEAKMRRRIPDVSPNEASVVLSVRIGDVNVLLGADLEEDGRRGFGWSAILEDHVTASKPAAECFKIPHHGSPTGHHVEVWNRMLVPNPLSALSPFKKGKVVLPSTTDTARIMSLTSRGYITSPSRARKFKESNRAVERTVREVARSASVWPSGWGQIRMRKRLDDGAHDAEWTVELFGTAIALARAEKIKPR